jgi:hypothetical protein
VKCHQPQENIAKFGYKQDISLKKNHPSVLTYQNQILKNCFFFLKLPFRSQNQIFEFEKLQKFTK